MRYRKQMRGNQGESIEHASHYKGDKAKAVRTPVQGRQGKSMAAKILPDTEELASQQPMAPHVIPARPPAYKCASPAVRC